MTELIACLSTGKGTWKKVVDLIKCYEWEQVFLVAPEFALKKFSMDRPIEFVVIDQNKNVEQLVLDITKQMKEKIKGTQVALNFVSGSGKEHMAVISAVLKMGLALRLVMPGKEDVVEV
ncbi:MAG: hypothetical protein MAG795_00779 [Candidatus Woesearchaeota archaeon]|nr:hypothetical protein [Candidatus Woesearchaeota archaeon]